MAVVAAGDTVTLVGKPPFNNVQITDYRGGRLVFRGVSREVLRIPIEQVQSLEIDGLEALNAAERAAGSADWATAARHYENALTRTGERWLADLMALRMLEVCDRAGRFDRAVELFVELVDAKGGGTTVRPPKRAGPCGSAENRTARRKLERAIETTRSITAQEIFRKLYFELLIADDAEDFDRLFPPPAADGRGAAGGSISLAASPLAPAEGNLVRPAVLNALASGEGERALRMVRRMLPYVESAERAPFPGHPAESTGEAGKSADVDGHSIDPAGSANRTAIVKTVDAAGKYDRDGWRLLLGRAQIQAGDAVAAIAGLIELAHRARDAAVAVEALYYAGLAHERIDRADVAEELYREVLGKEAASAEMRLLAGKGLERTRAK